VKIILIHYRYYEASGPESYLFNIKKVLEDNGHEVIPFSLNYPENINSKYSEFFPTPVTSKFHINNEKKNITLISKLKIIKNGFYNVEAYKHLKALILATKPDVAYVLQYGTKLSTSIFDILSIQKVPIVLRISDFNLICAKNTFYRKGSTCTKCINNKRYSVYYKCVHGSLIQSILYFIIQKFNEYRKFEKKISAIVSPSNFSRNLISSEQQFSSTKIVHIPTFTPKIDTHSERKNIPRHVAGSLKICYVGRIADDKGVDILIEAIMNLINKGLDVHLDVIGDDNNNYTKLLKEKSSLLHSCNIVFKGHLPKEMARKVYQNYHFSVIPSKWFDNMPNSLIESCMSGVPVIVSRIGSLSELVTDGYNGYTFNTNDSSDLESVIERLFYISQYEYNKLSVNSFSWVNEHCDQNLHYSRLIDLFNEVIDEKYYK
jgi:glycosyltransferase involved in cell wall biosynthesis